MNVAESVNEMYYQLHNCIRIYNCTNFLELHTAR